MLYGSIEQYQAFLYSLSIWVVPGLFAITVHEAAHGLAALYYGDKTAFFLGRTSLNPIKHIDPVGTILLPLFLLYTQSHFLFGWAKPVPINTRNLKKTRTSLAVIALAGPASNFLMCVLWLLIAKLASVLYTSSPSPQLEWLLQTANIGIFFNIILGVFNCLPIPPLDGSKILQAILPLRLSEAFDIIEPYGLLIVMALIFSGLLSAIVSPPILFLYRLAVSVLLPIS